MSKISDEVYSVFQKAKGDWMLGHQRHALDHDFVERAERNGLQAILDSGEVVPRKEVEELVGACKKTIKDNLHLADGDNCTLYVLREALAKFTDKRW